MRPDHEVKDLIKKLDDKTTEQMDKRLLGDVIQKMEETNRTNSVIEKPTLRRIVMKNPITKLATAAAIAIVVLIAMPRLGDSTAGVVWGEVVRNIEASPGFIYRMKQTTKQMDTGTTELNKIVYGSARYGLRSDYYNQDQELRHQHYSRLGDESSTSVFHLSRTYIRNTLEDDAVTEIQNMDPKEAVKRILSSDYTELGRRTINGVVAEGVEIIDSPEVKTNYPVDSCIFQLWVAVDTGLPVLVEMDIVGRNGTLEVHSIQENFEWNVELDASEFDPDIPDDYEEIGVEIDAEGNMTHKTKTTVNVDGNSTYETTVNNDS